MTKSGSILGISLFFAALAFPALAENKYASIVVEARTGMVLEAQQAEELRHPASLTKLMTLYLTFKALKQGALRMNEALPVSEYAAAQAPSKLGLRPGTTIRVREAVLGVITESANDAAVVLAEAIGGSEDLFAGKMTHQARHLGMTRTRYRNASGLPNDGQITTARDMAILARALQFNFPEYYPLFRTARFTWHGVTHDNHNHLMSRYPGMDGLKTGYIRASGFNLVASAVRGKTRLIGVVFGGVSARERDRDMERLLNLTFAWVGNHGALLTAHKAAPVPIDAKDEEDVAPTGPIAGNGAIPPQLALTVTDQPVAEGDGPSDDATANRPPAPAPQYVRLESPQPGIATDSTARADTSARPTRPPVKTIGLSRPLPVQNVRWSVQIGAYSSKSGSEQAARKVGAHLPRQLTTARYEIVEVNNGKTRLYRARLTGLDEAAARHICRSMSKSRHSCTLIPPAGQ